MPPWEVEHYREILTAVIRVIQSSSTKQSTRVAVKHICKQRKNNTYVQNSFAYAEAVDGSVVRYPACVKSGGFRSKFKASRESSNTDEL